MVVTEELASLVVILEVGVGVEVECPARAIRSVTLTEKLEEIDRSANRPGRLADKLFLSVSTFLHRNSDCFISVRRVTRAGTFLFSYLPFLFIRFYFCSIGGRDAAKHLA